MNCRGRTMRDNFVDDYSIGCLEKSTRFSRDWPDLDRPRRRTASATRNLVGTRRRRGTPASSPSNSRAPVRAYRNRQS